MSPMTTDPTTRYAVPWNAVNIRKAKKAARFGAVAVAIVKLVRSTLEVMNTQRRPRIFANGPQKMGLMAMKTKNMALETLMMALEVSNAAAISGMAIRRAVELMGVKKPQ